MNKLPRVTLLFWIMKIAATTLGETAGDLLSMTLKVGYAASSMMLITLFFCDPCDAIEVETISPVVVLDRHPLLQYFRHRAGRFLG